LPEWITEAPEPPEHQSDVWEAFHILSDSRQSGMSVGPIPLTEIESFFRMFSINDPDLVHEWLTLIREMDNEFMQFMRNKEDK